MTGRDHWIEAERLLATSPSDSGARAQAQVHALLALAAPPYGFHQPRPEAVPDYPPHPLARGGWVTPRAAYLVGEQGPEIITRNAQP
jgi:hypothetical protein